MIMQHSALVLCISCSGYALCALHAFYALYALYAASAQLEPNSIPGGHRTGGRQPAWWPWTWLQATLACSLATLDLWLHYLSDYFRSVTSSMYSLYSMNKLCCQHQLEPSVESYIGQHCGGRDVPPQINIHRSGHAHCIPHSRHTVYHTLCHIAQCIVIPHPCLTIPLQSSIECTHDQPLANALCSGHPSLCL